MISESGGGVFFPVDETGVTRLTETGTFAGATPSDLSRPVDPLPYVRRIVPVLVPRWRAAGSDVTVNVTPSGPSVPDVGLTVSHGLSVLAVKVTGGFCPGTKTCCAIPFSVPTSTVV